MQRLRVLTVLLTPPWSWQRLQRLGHVRPCVAVCYIQAGQEVMDAKGTPAGPCQAFWDNSRELICVTRYVSCCEGMHKPLSGPAQQVIHATRFQRRLVEQRWAPLTRRSKGTPESHWMGSAL